MSAKDEGPITDDELAALFGGLRNWPVIGLAVSGGADSLALLQLYARWLGGAPSPPMTLVLTVDHQLRAGSGAEAEFVARHTKSLGLHHETLIWDEPKPLTGRAEAARDARYRLMSHRLAREPAAPRAVVTAHTQDDQAETLLMRLARGSGVAGLAAMKAQRLLPAQDGVALVRPLLGVSKARLEATLIAAGHTWVNDPTNADLRFERPRLRLGQAARHAAGLTNAALAQTAARLARADVALIAATDALEAAAVRADPGVSALIDLALFSAAPDELRVRLLDRLLRSLGGLSPPPRMSELEALAGRWLHLVRATTLGGCVIEPQDRTVSIFRETGRTGLETLELAPGACTTWDGRFRVALAATAPASCLVRALDAQSWSHLSAACPALRPVSARAALTLPSFWVDDQLICVPRLGPLTLKPGFERHMPCIAPQSTLEALGALCGANPLPGAATRPC